MVRVRLKTCDRDSSGPVARRPSIYPCDRRFMFAVLLLLVLDCHRLPPPFFILHLFLQPHHVDELQQAYGLQQQQQFVSCSWTPVNPVWEPSSDSGTLAPVSTSPRPAGKNATAGQVLAFTAFGRRFRLRLWETEHLIHEDFTTHHHHHDDNSLTAPATGDSATTVTAARATTTSITAPPTASIAGQIVENKIGKLGSEGCHWQGHVEGSREFRVALSTCPQLGGIIWNGEEALHLHSNGTHSLIARFEDHQLTPTADLKCGHNGTMASSRKRRGTASAAPASAAGEDGRPRSRHRRGAASLTSLKRGPSGAKAQSRFVELVIVQDHRQFVKFGRDERKLFDRSKQVANIVNALYAPLNIFVVLVGVRVWSQRDEIEVDTNAEKTLDNFLRYRMEVLARSMPNDNAQLITDVTFEQDVVGKALKGPICTYQYSGGVNKDHHESVAVVAATIAHELGHNFGLEHDDIGQCHCPQSRCIMYPASNILVPPSAWSSCSVEAFADSFAQHMDHCLRNVPKRVVGPSCGNGLVEDGEQCDCGPEHLCTTRCCDARTCTLAPTATCGHGACCDLETCKPKASGFACRTATGECDLAEFCDGYQPDCPADVFKANGVKCGDGNAYCYMGSCSSHDMQCKKLWGPTGSVGHRSCFSVNVNGTQIGNCGYDKIRKTFAKCKPRDVMCGTLHCTHLNERLEYGMLSAAKLSRFFLRTEKESHTCRSAVVDLGATDPDPGQAADGAACGATQACLGSRCVELAQLASPACEYGCFGHGTCNHLGHCHCDAGFAPPYCNFPGHGGSIDSGPATNPEDGSYTRMVVLALVFLVLTPLVLVFMAWTIFSRKDLMSKWRLRRRKLAVKQAARQGPLLSLYDKSQISKPVASVTPRILSAATVAAATGKEKLPPTENGVLHNNYTNGTALSRSLKPTAESDIDSRLNGTSSVIRPARPAPPPPPMKATQQTSPNFVAPSGRTASPEGLQSTTALHQQQQQTQQQNLKRAKSIGNGGSVRRPNAPPPPLPSAPPVCAPSTDNTMRELPPPPVNQQTVHNDRLNDGLSSQPDSDLYENVDIIQAHLAAEQRNNLRNREDRDRDESSPLV